MDENKTLLHVETVPEPGRVRTYFTKSGDGAPQGDTIVWCWARYTQALADLGIAVRFKSENYCLGQLRYGQRVDLDAAAAAYALAVWMEEEAVREALPEGALIVINNVVSASEIEGARSRLAALRGAA